MDENYRAERVMPAKPLVHAHGLQKTYHAAEGDVEALHDIGFTIEPGEFVAVLGPSGCGKSTLLMALAGIETLSAGELSIGGRAVDGPRRETAVVFQDPTLLPWKSALENVLYPARLQGLPIAPYRDRAATLLDRVGLHGFHHRRPRQLSGGMKQRVALCRALAQEPSLLLMDEPFSALDAIARDEMNAVLLDLWEAAAGRTAVFVTHSIKEAALLADRVLVMRRRPCTIVAEITVPFPRPRPPDLVDDPAFVTLCAGLRRHIERGLYA